MRWLRVTPVEFVKPYPTLRPRSRAARSWDATADTISTLVVLVPEVADAADRLRNVYPPLYEDEWRDDWAAFRLPGPPQVDIVVTKRGTKGDAHHRRAWELLLADDVLRAEYERLKAAGMDSVQKAAFFERVVARLGDSSSRPG
jgi:hypothetical protein